MENKEILKHIDHTLLKAYSSFEDIKILCDEAIKNETASVCIPQTYIKRVKDNYPSLNVCTVIGFPLGYNSTKSKVVEAENAMEDGASEIDMVIEIGRLKEKDYDYVLNDIKACKEACGKNVLKVIIETCLLTDEEKIKACELAVKAGADFVKTSTGFSQGGAKASDISLMRKTVGENIGVKASGGIHNKKEAMEMVEAGANRIGASKSIEICK